MAKLINTDNRRESYPEVTLVARAAPGGLKWAIVAYEVAPQFDWQAESTWTWFVANDSRNGNYTRNGTMDGGSAATLADVQAKAIKGGYILAA